MFSRLTRSLLFVSSLTVGLTLWAILAGLHHTLWASISLLFLIAVGAVALYMIMREAAPRQEAALHNVTLVRKADDEVVTHTVLSFLMFLLLPFPWGSWVQGIVVGAVLVFLGAVYVRGNSIAANPLLLLAGYHLYEVQIEQEQMHQALLARQVIEGVTPHRIVSLGNNLFLSLGCVVFAPAEPAEQTDNQQQDHTAS